MFFKSEEHENQTKQILKVLGKERIEDNIEYGLFAYIVGATYKGNHIIDCINDEGFLDVEKIYEKIKVYSNSERSMIRFALQCYNSSLDDIPLSEVMRSLDFTNVQVIKEAINLRY